MAKETMSEQQAPALTRSSPLLTWRALAAQQWLHKENARLEIQLALAARVQDFVSQLQKRITARQSWIQEQLVTQGSSGGSTQTPGQRRSRVPDIIEQLAQEKNLSPQALNAALIEHGLSPLSYAEAQGQITTYLQQA
jgi:hypothetical protein